MHKPAGVVENLVQIIQNTPILKFRIPPLENWNLGRSWDFVTFQFQNTPSPENWNLGRSWDFVTFQFQNTPLPRKLKFRQILGLCDFSVSEYPPPPHWNLGRSWHFVTFQFQNTPPPWKLKFRQILGLCDFSVSEYPPPPQGRSSQWETMCGKLPHVETLSNPDNYSFILYSPTQRSVRFWSARPTKEHTQICCKINCLSFRIAKPVDYKGQTCKEYVLLAKVKSVSLKNNMISNWKSLLKGRR